MKEYDKRYLDSPFGRVVAEWEPLTIRGATWIARTYIYGEQSTVKETKHVGREPRLAAMRAGIRRMKNIAAGCDPMARGWGGKRTRPADKRTAAVTMRAHVPVELAARLVEEANAAGTSVAIHVGRVLQEARP
jgi:hypothetical protein